MKTTVLEIDVLELEIKPKFFKAPSCEAVQLKRFGMIVANGGK